MSVAAGPEIRTARRSERLSRNLFTSECSCLLRPKARLQHAGYAESACLDLYELPCQSDGQTAVNGWQALPRESAGEMMIHCNGTVWVYVLGWIAGTNGMPGFVIGDSDENAVESKKRLRAGRRMCHCPVSPVRRVRQGSAQRARR